jgi:hypothetical protein
MDKSTYTLVKEFSPVTGSLSFTSSLDNPNLDVVAEYTGLHKTSAGNEETIRINLLIKGPRNDLQLTMELYRKNLQGEFVKDSRSTDEVKADVLMYLTSGSFASDAGGPTTQGGLASAGYSVLSGAASTILSNYLNKTGVIRSVGLEYGGVLASKVKLSSGYKEIVLNYGGTFNNSTLTSSDLSLEIPFSQFFNFPFAHNILFQGEYHIANSSDVNSQGLTQPPIFLGRFLVRLTP